MSDTLNQKLLDVATRLREELFKEVRERQMALPDLPMGSKASKLSVARLEHLEGVLRESHQVLSKGLTNRSKCPNCERFRETLPSGGWAECPGCGKTGCDDCLPGGRNCLCPECEESNG